ncbi:MAG TPA: hypothetical protein P5071_01840 [Paludibacteraceae bacterium]|nr:hypothetical protein [Paludibacteraceae bacterium]HPC26705.1 hypothetical protein [Paludibacteraceae bacterium]HPO66782.1 hypothetical protein [Paludibacteraceae bacterium]HRR62563.1 hypothetical protein [Paludibacteraceae bacterium]HRU63805.1 hypothetical protein [Paludibacteraceae bacterium]
MYNESLFLSAISESYKNFVEYGPRSNKKLIPLHTFVGETLQNIWGKDFELYFISESTKEFTVEGKYYPKAIDITVAQNGIPVFCFGVKFITSNYKQNSNNYFENMMGETANIQAKKDLPYAQLIILRHETPYYEKTVQKSGRKKATKIEIINEYYLQKYLNLIFDSPQAHRPFAMGIILINVNEQTCNVEKVNLNSVFEADFAELFEKKLSITAEFKLH